MERKRIRITGKRQITIPQKYFDMLGFTNEAECVLRNNEIVIRPVNEQTGGEFSEYILKDLISQGYSGEELLTQFKLAQRQIRPAVERMLEDASNAAYGKGEFSTYNDIFNSEN